MKKYILLAKEGNKAYYAYERKPVQNYKQVNQYTNYFSFYGIPMSIIEQMENGTFKYSYSLEEAQRLQKKFYRARRKYKKTGKNKKGYWNNIDMFIIPISKMLKLNKDKLKQRKRTRNQKVKLKRSIK